MNMRDIIRIIEGEIVPFKRPDRPSHQAVEPTWTDNGDGFQSKPLAMSDLFGNESPHPPKTIEIGYTRNEQRAVEVRWDNWMRAFLLPELSRMLKLRVGDGFEAVDEDRYPSAGFPSPHWKVKREPTNFVLTFTNWSIIRGDNGLEKKVCQFGYIEYGIPVDDLTVAFHRLKRMLAR